MEVRKTDARSRRENRVLLCSAVSRRSGTGQKLEWGQEGLRSVRQETWFAGEGVCKSCALDLPLLSALALRKSGGWFLGNKSLQTFKKLNSPPAHFARAVTLAILGSSFASGRNANCFPSHSIPCFHLGQPVPACIEPVFACNVRNVEIP